MKRLRFAIIAWLVAGSIAGGTSWSRDARAETAVKETSCAEAADLTAFYQWCQQIFGPGFCSLPDIAQCWDFETGLGGWSMTGSAFSNQPTYGDNVGAERVLRTKPSALRAGFSMADEMSAIGGDYWNTAYPIGNQGQAWLGTFENRPSPSSPWGAVQGDSPTGTAISPSFVIDRNLLEFLIGGGCDSATERIELQTYQPPTTVCRPVRTGQICTAIPGIWLPTLDNTGHPLVATGTCNDELQRRTFDLFGLSGKTARIVVADTSGGPWGHINVDHILLTNAIAQDFDAKNIPLWGFADTHAHLDNEHSMRSLGGTATDGYVLHGSVGSITTDRSVLASQLPSCDGAWHHSNGYAYELLYELEHASLGNAPGLPLGCSTDDGNCSVSPQSVAFATTLNHAHPSFGISPYGDLSGWPYWYTRAHQQMHLTWIQRAYAGGQRLMVAAAGNTSAFGFAMGASHSGNYLSDYGALRRFALNVKQLAAANASWLEIAFSPSEARRIIQQNKLAIVLATEVDDLGDHCTGDFVSSAADDPLDHGATVSTSSGPVIISGIPQWRWNELRDRTNASSCTTPAQWTTRIDNLYRAGYRVIMPVHLSDNDLGGTAIYDDKFNTNTRFMTGSWISASVSSDVTYTFPQGLAFPGQWSGAEVGWLLGTTYTVKPYPALLPYPYPFDNLTNLMAPGFVNTRALTSNGLTVIDAAKARGMVIDIAHLDQKGREKILGLANNALSSPLSPSCDLSSSVCQLAAYPVVSTHGGLREMQSPRDFTGGGADEGGLRADMIARIRDIGGIVAVGTSAADTPATDAVVPAPAPGTYTQNVANTCGGSTRSFAQNYLYLLRRMNGKGITLGTDANGIEDRLNPRFGTQGCYARGNVPRSYQVSWPGNVLVDSSSRVPFRFRPSILGSSMPTAGSQRNLQSTGLNYSHYSGPPSGVAFRGVLDPPGYVANLIVGNFSAITSFGVLSTPSMSALSNLPAINPSRTGMRTFDYNYDGLAHYGMLPDMLQDSRVVGLTQEQLAPLFQGAEAFVETWERGCSLADWTVSHDGCF